MNTKALQVVNKGEKMKNILPSKSFGSNPLLKLSPTDILSLAKNGVELAQSTMGYLEKREETKRMQIASDVEIAHSNNACKESLAKISLASKQIDKEMKSDKLASKERVAHAHMKHEENMKKLDTLEKIILSGAMSLNDENTDRIINALLK